MSLPLQQLETQIAHNFENKTLIETAFTHSSVPGSANYERLEFLGDRVLGLVTAELLYARFPNEQEGDLAKRLATLVQGECLAEIAKEMDLGAYIIMSESEAQAGGRENAHILADVFESMIGALYLDSDFQTCKNLIERMWGDRLDVMKAPPQHPKTKVQEWTQGRGKDLPVYEIVERSGPDHAPIFKIKLSIEGHEPIIATGKSRQAAEKQAALEFITALESKQ